MNDIPILNYYADIIPDHARFREIACQPLPLCFWTNVLKINAETLQNLLEAENYKIEPLTWNPYAFRCRNNITELGKSWQYLVGLLQIQEEVSMIPPFVLIPNQDDQVLDICAAPGNKSAQMSVMMGNKGTLITNDFDYQRMRAYGQISKRLGLINTSTTIYDGRKFPQPNTLFSKILVDAPCSGEGTFRKQGNKVIIPNQTHSLSFHRIQKQLLIRAIQLCAPGGQIVYSTCTFAPEENEQVIDEVLTEYASEVELLPIQFPNFKTCEGLTEWKKQRYDSSIRKCLRIWPHLNDTGGFFVALLQKKGRLPIAKKIINENSVSNVDQHIKLLNQHFNFDSSLFDQYHITQASKVGLYITNKDNMPDPEIKKDITGLLFLKTRSRFPKLTTAVTMLLGKFAKNNKMHLTANQLAHYLNQETFSIDEKQLENFTQTGYIIVAYKNVIIGLGLLKKTDEGYLLQSQFPGYFI